MGAERFFDSVANAADFGKWSEEWCVRQLDIAPNTINGPLRELWQEIGARADIMDHDAPRSELHDVSRKLREFHNTISCFLDQSSEDSVHLVDKQAVMRQRSRYMRHRSRLLTDCAP